MRAPAEEERETSHPERRGARSTETQAGGSAADGEVGDLQEEETEGEAAAVGQEEGGGGQGKGGGGGGGGGSEEEEEGEEEEEDWGTNAWLLTGRAGGNDSGTSEVRPYDCECFCVCKI